MEKRHDDRDAEKTDDRELNERDENQQAAELQIGEEDERANPSRFEPDPKAEKQPVFGES